MLAKFLTLMPIILVPIMVFGQEESGVSPKQLNEVTVSARSSFRSENGHLIVIPDRQQKKHSFTGYDLLSNMMIPGVSVNRATGEVSALFGSVSLYINGIKATNAEVKALRPKDILSVEYYDAPTGVYAGENTVINFIVRTPETGGYGEVNAEQKVGYQKGDYGFAGKVVSQKTAIQLFGGYGMTSIAADRKNGHADYNFEEGRMIEDFLTLSGRDKSNKTYFQGDVTNSDDKRTWQASLFYDCSQSPLRSSLSQTDYSGIYSSQVRQNSHTTEFSRQGGGRLHGKLNLNSNQSIFFTTRVAVTRNDYSYMLSQSGDTDIEEIVVDNAAKENRWQMDVHAGYSKKFKHGQSLSITINNFFKNTASDYYGTNPSESKLWSNEEILFIQYVRPLSEHIMLSLMPGISALHYKQNDKKQLNFVSPRFQMRLTARLSNNHFFMVNGNIGNSFPNISYISNAEQSVNAFRLKRGNSELKNTKMYQAMGVYGYNAAKYGLQLMVMYQFNHNLPVSSFSQEGSRIIQSWTDRSDNHVVQSNVSVTYKPLQTLSLNLSGVYTCYMYSGYQRISAHSPSLSFNANYVISNFMISAEVKTPEKWMSNDLARVTTPWEYSLACNYALKNWKFELGTNNPFIKNARYYSRSYNPVFNEVFSLMARNHSQTAYLKVAYSFDWGKNVNKTKLQRTEMQIENALIKAK
ncbi:MAG: hypothetical protein K2K82_05805 [Muribaculaceae bacterium]|nr:hypothetical protein [Muribaculaceae bacterium]